MHAQGIGRIFPIHTTGIFVPQVLHSMYTDTVCAVATATQQFHWSYLCQRVDLYDCVWHAVEVHHAFDLIVVHICRQLARSSQDSVSPVICQIVDCQVKCE